MTKKYHISVTGLGYVGLSVATAFGQKTEVIAYDCSSKRINQLQQGIDFNKEVDAKLISSPRIHYTTDPSHLAEANFHIICAPTPLQQDKRPNLTPLIDASMTVGRFLKKDAIVVYESTVYIA